MTRDEPSKNHPGGANDMSSNEKEARMYAIDQEVDGYKALDFYLKKSQPQLSCSFSVSHQEELEANKHNLIRKSATQSQQIGQNDGRYQ